MPFRIGSESQLTATWQVLFVEQVQSWIGQIQGPKSEYEVGRFMRHTSKVARAFENIADEEYITLEEAAEARLLQKAFLRMHQFPPISR